MFLYRLEKCKEQVAGVIWAYVAKSAEYLTTKDDELVACDMWLFMRRQQERESTAETVKNSLRRFR